MEEIWKAIPDYPGYEASNLGRIRSLKRKSPRILKTPIGQGYPHVNLVVNGKCHCRRVHWFVARAFLGPRPKGLVVCHNDGNPTNNALSNLRYDTPQSNVQDTIRHGHKSKKLVPEQIVEIRNLYARGFNYQTLAKKYNVTQSTISNICTGKTWAKLPGETFKPYESERQRAKQIRETYATKCYTMTQLAKEYGLSLSAISLIINNKR